MHSDHCSPDPAYLLDFERLQVAKEEAKAATAKFAAELAGIDLQRETARQLAAAGDRTVSMSATQTADN